MSLTTYIYFAYCLTKILGQTTKVGQTLRLCHHLSAQSDLMMQHRHRNWVRHDFKSHLILILFAYLLIISSLAKDRPLRRKRTGRSHRQAQDDNFEDAKSGMHKTCSSVSGTGTYSTTLNTYESTISSSFLFH